MRQRRPSGASQCHVRVGHLNLDPRACLAPDECREQGGTGGGPLCGGLQLRGVPRGGQFGIGRLLAQVGHVLALPGDLPQVMVMVAGHVVDHPAEHGRTIGECLVRKEPEYHGGQFVRGQRQVQDVPGQDERRRLVLITGEVTQAVDQSGQHRARLLGIDGKAGVRCCRRALGQRGQHAVLGPEVQVRHDHVADVSQGDTPSRRPRPRTWRKAKADTLLNHGQLIAESSD